MGQNTSNKSTYTQDISDVIREERERIGIEKNDQKLYGLAISGGGIRSASFAMGVLQALVLDKIDLLKRIHYLSTVSGGGYIGSSLTWFLRMGLPNGTKAGTTADKFPFGFKGKGARNQSSSGNEILDFIRQNANYLTPGKGLNIVSLFGVVMRSTFVSLLVYFSLLTVVFTGLTWLGAFETFSQLPLRVNTLLNLAAGLVGLIFSFAIIYSMTTLFKAQYNWMIFAQRSAGKAWALTFGLVLLGVTPMIAAYIDNMIINSSTGLGGVLMGLYEQFRNRKPESEEGALSKVRVLAGVAALIYGLLVLACVVANVGIKEYGYQWVILPSVIVIVVGMFVNLNVFGLHRMYRDRLMETFMADKDNLLKNLWGPAKCANKTLLQEMCSKEINPKPYHLINTNLITTDSPRPKYNGRGGDNFILSPLYCGSDATGWQTTNHYRKHRVGNRGLTLATAMAISGAAVNPSAGPDGQGLTKNMLVSMLLGLLNIQLGFWSDNPDPEKKGWLRFPSNFLKPGLFGNVLGRHLSETRPSILLTDGGHFENLGAYELIRRRLNVIIVSDAGADPDFVFEDLTNLIEKVRVDFGTKVRFRKEFPLKDLIPEQEDGTMGKKLTLAKRGFAVADLTYSADEDTEANRKGILIYIKSTLPSGLPTDLYGYKLSHPTYPDETTADQFFDEVQFEAYRELGFQLTKRVDWSLI